VVWAIKHFQHYLGLKPFTVITDHSALKWLKTAKMPKGRRARWIMELQQYDFQVKHRPGKLNANADALSRAPDNNINIESQCFLATVRKQEESFPDISLEMLIEESENSYEADSEDNDSEEERIVYTPRRNKGKEEIIQPEPCKNCGEINCIGCNFWENDSDKSYGWSSPVFSESEKSVQITLTDNI